MTDDELRAITERNRSLIRNSKRMIAVNVVTIILSLSIIVYHIATWPR